MSCDYKEYKVGSSYKVYSVHPTTLFCIIQVTKASVTTAPKRTSKTAETPTGDTPRNYILKPGMFGSKSKTNLTLNLNSITSKGDTSLTEFISEESDDFRPKTMR